MVVEVLKGGELNMDNAAEFLLTVIAILVVSLVLAIAPAIHLSSLGAGKHTGFITAVEQEGYIFPNYRVYVKTDNSSSQEDTYCLNRDKADLATRAKEFSKTRQLVSISFQGVRGFGYGLCGSPEITDINIDK